MNGPSRPARRCHETVRMTNGDQGIALSMNQEEGRRYGTCFEYLRSFMSLDRIFRVYNELAMITRPEQDPAARESQMRQQGNQLAHNASRASELRCLLFEDLRND